MARRRVVVTGLGLVTPQATGVKASWEAILAGKSGAAPISHFDASAYSTQFAACVKNWDVSEYMNPKDARKYDLFMQYGLVAGIQAMADSGLEITDELAPRAGTIIGSGTGGLKGIEDGRVTLDAKGPRRISPFFVPGSISNMISGNLSIMYNLKGPNISVVTACTTGTHSIGLAARSIQYGEADVMLAGGAEAASTPLGMAGFAAARALSTRNDEPEKASRPWDRDRDGFLLGDGAGVVVLEEYQHAKARGAKIYGELIGFGMSGDAFHMTSPPENGEGAQLSMENALRDAQINPGDVDYINAHGTSTPLGDIAECRAIKGAFGDHAYKLAVSSTKSVTGHLLGAAGAVEAILSVLALKEQALPGTFNLDNPDEGCDLDFVANESRQSQLQIALSNSFGFGGTNATLVFRRQ